MPTVTPLPFVAPLQSGRPFHACGSVRLLGALDCIFSSETARFSGLLGASPGRSALLPSSPPAADPRCSLPCVNSPPAWAAWSLCSTPAWPLEIVYVAPPTRRDAAPKRLFRVRVCRFWAVPALLPITRSFLGWRWCMAYSGRFPLLFGVSICQLSLCPDA